MTGLLLSILICAADPPAPDTIVVCPESFLPALQPWLEHRSKQGHRFAFVSNLDSDRQIRDAIRRTAQSKTVKSVLLVGDALPQNADPPQQLRARSVPTHFAEAKVNVRWGSEPEIATDNYFADLNDDQVPDLAIGRIPADSPDELRRIVAKILRYESSQNHSLWRRKINFVAGVGGFGKVADSILEMTTKKFLTSGIPPAYATTMTYASWRSPYCPDPRRFHQCALDRLNEGSLFWIYIGHGHKWNVDRVQVPGGSFHILGNQDTARLRCKNGSPIAVFLACYTAAFDQPQDCLAEEMLRADGGPVAVLGGSRVTMPYAMAVLGTAMMDECFQQQRPSIGEMILHAKRRLAQKPAAPSADDPQAALDDRQLLDAIASVISPAPNLLDEERREHLLLFNLLGDPLLRIKHPQRFTLTSAEEVMAGENLQLTGHCPIGGRCTIELVCRRDLLRTPGPVRRTYDPSPAALSAYDKDYYAANDHRFASFTAKFAGGDFRTFLPVPDQARGPCHVRVHLEGSDGCALGSAKVFVRRPKTEP